MARIVLDANVIISAAFGGAPLEAVNHACRHTIYINDEIEKELLGVIERLKAKLSPVYLKEARKQVRMIIHGARKAKCGHSVKICRDPKDNAYLELAKSCRIDILVTGDDDLLSLSAEELRKEGLHRLKIMTPRDFVNESIRSL